MFFISWIQIILFQDINGIESDMCIWVENMQSHSGF